jgi:quercetin dioxygenase-like cupin family protein
MARIFSLTEKATDVRRTAATQREGRSSLSLHEGEASVLRQTVTALLAGKSMELEHPPTEGWILVLEGELSLQMTNELNGTIPIPTGSLVQLPHGSLTLTANQDSTMLLTVAMGDRPG